VVFEHSGMDEIPNVVGRGNKGESAKVIIKYVLFEASDKRASGSSDTIRSLRVQINVPNIHTLG